MVLENRQLKAKRLYGKLADKQNEQTLIKVRGYAAANKTFRCLFGCSTLTSCMCRLAGPTVIEGHVPGFLTKPTRP